MKVTTKSLIGVVAVVVLASTAFASMKSDMQANYDKVCKVFKTKDMGLIKKTLMSMSTKDFKMVMPGGKTQTGEEAMKDMEMHMKMCKSIDVCTAEVVSVKMSKDGKSCNVVEKMHMKMTVNGMDPKDKKTHKMEDWSVSTDKWVMVGKSWKMASMTTTSDKMTMDGKPFNPDMAMKSMTAGKKK